MTRIVKEHQYSIVWIASNLTDTTDWCLIVTCDQVVYNQVQYSIIF